MFPMPHSRPAHARAARRAAVCFAALGSLVFAAAAEEVDLMRELRRAAEEAGVELDLPVWDISGELEAGFGYADNVTLAPIDPESSTLARAVGTVLAWREVGDDVELVGYADATYTRYFSASTDDATLAIARMEGRWRPEGAWRANLAAQGIYQDEVIDASSLENDLGAVHAHLGNIALLATAECDVTRVWAVGLSPAVRRFDYRAPLDDFTESEAATTVARSLGGAGTLTLAARAMWRDYDDRPQAGPAGRPIYGTHLAVHQTGVDVRHQVERDHGNSSWTARLRAGYLENRDNGSGYYDYDRWSAAVSGTLTRGAWTVDAEAGWYDTTYLVQLAGFGIDPARRARSEWRGFLRLERRLGEGVSLFGEWEFFDSDSNDLFIDYESTVALAGARFAF
jgi:hypothetical protein